MDRRNPQASTGGVNWPDAATSGAQGGMAVWALIPEGPDWEATVACFPGLEVRAQITESPTWGEPGTVYDILWPGLYGRRSQSWSNAQEDALYVSQPLRAAVLLGTCGGNWETQDGAPWQATYEDLNHVGRLLVETLREIHQLDPVLVTILDT